MANTIYTAVNLLDKTNGSLIGIIRFDASGRLDYHVVKKGMHISAFKPIERFLNEQWMKEPLYKKHASLLDENKKLPGGILVREADSCVKFLNSLESPLMLDGHFLKAKLIYSIIESE